MRPRVERSVGRSLFGADPLTHDAVRPGHPGEVYVAHIAEDVFGERVERPLVTSLCAARPG